jgi:prophage tail gpP-like protein
MARKPDTVHVEAVGVGKFDRFTSLQIVNDITQPSFATFELGDDGTWRELNEFIKPGTQYRVFVNGRPRLTGRVDANDVPSDVAGTSVRFTVRTKLADAAFASADPRLKIKNVTLGDLIFKAFEPLGYKREDFSVEADLARNIMTGAPRGSSKGLPDIEALKEEDAKPSPPETILEFASRHLARFGLMIWDAPDGRIVINAPYDEQDPLYYFRMLQGAQGAANNLVRANRMKDWTQVPTLFGVFGTGGKADFMKSKIGAIAEDPDLAAAGFYRPVLVQSDGVKTKEMAQRAATRELSQRSRAKESWELTPASFTYRTGNEAIPYGIDTCCDIQSSVAGGPAGAYYIWRVTLGRSASTGDTAQLSAVRKGTWKL